MQQDGAEDKRQDIVADQSTLQGKVRIETSEVA